MSTECCLFLENWAVNHVISGFCHCKESQVSTVSMPTSPRLQLVLFQFINLHLQHKRDESFDHRWESAVEACIDMCRENLPGETCNICAVWWWNLWWSTFLQRRQWKKELRIFIRKSGLEEGYSCYKGVAQTLSWNRLDNNNNKNPLDILQTVHSFVPVRPHQHRGATASLRGHDGSNDIRSKWNPAFRTVSDIHGFLYTLKWNIAGSTLGLYRLNGIIGYLIIQNEAY